MLTKSAAYNQYYCCFTNFLVFNKANSLTKYIFLFSLHCFTFIQNVKETSDIDMIILTKTYNIPHVTHYHQTLPGVRLQSIDCATCGAIPTINFMIKLDA